MAENTERLTTHEIRQKLGMSQHEFAINYNVPDGTVKNWDARGCCPAIVVKMGTELAELYKTERQYDKLMAILKTASVYEIEDMVGAIQQDRLKEWMEERSNQTE